MNFVCVLTSLGNKKISKKFEVILIGIKLQHELFSYEQNLPQKPIFSTYQDF